MQLSLKLHLNSYTINNYELPKPLGLETIILIKDMHIFMFVYPKC